MNGRIAAMPACAAPAGRLTCEVSGSSASTSFLCTTIHKSLLSLSTISGDVWCPRFSVLWRQMRARMGHAKAWTPNAALRSPSSILHPPSSLVAAWPRCDLCVLLRPTTAPFRFSVAPTSSRQTARPIHRVPIRQPMRVGNPRDSPARRSRNQRSADILVGFGAGARFGPTRMSALRSGEKSSPPATIWPDTYRVEVCATIRCGNAQQIRVSSSPLLEPKSGS